MESQFIAETSMLYLDAVQFPVQWVQDALSPGAERSVREAEHLHIGPGIRMPGTTPPFLHTFFAVRRRQFYICIKFRKSLQLLS